MKRKLIPLTVLAACCTAASAYAWEPLNLNYDDRLKGDTWLTVDSDISLDIENNGELTIDQGNKKGHATASAISTNNQRVIEKIDVDATAVINNASIDTIGNGHGILNVDALQTNTKGDATATASITRNSVLPETELFATATAVINNLSINTSEDLSSEIAQINHAGDSTATARINNNRFTVADGVVPPPPRPFDPAPSATAVVNNLSLPGNAISTTVAQQSVGGSATAFAEARGNIGVGQLTTGFIEVDATAVINNLSIGGANTSSSVETGSQ